MPLLASNAALGLLPSVAVQEPAAAAGLARVLPCQPCPPQPSSGRSGKGDAPPGCHTLKPLTPAPEQHRAQQRQRASGGGGTGSCGSRRRSESKRDGDVVAVASLQHSLVVTRCQLSQRRFEAVEQQCALVKQRQPAALANSEQCDEKVGYRGRASTAGIEARHEGHDGRTRPRRG